MEETSTTKLLTREEVQTRLRLKREAVLKMLNAGLIPGAFKVGRDWRIPEGSLMKFIEARQAEAAQ